MVELRHEADFAGKTLRPKRRREVGTQHLERDLAVVLEVPSQEDGGHAAGPDFSVNDVLPGECRGEAGLQVGHGFLDGGDSGKMGRGR